MSVGTTRVTVVDGDGKEHIADFSNPMIDQACVFCETLHFGMNFLAMSGTYFCNDCWYKMGMRPVGGGAYAHLEQDVLFIGNRANIPACPTYDPDFGKSTPFHIIKKVKGKPRLRRAIARGTSTCAGGSSSLTVSSKLIKSARPAKPA